MKVVNFYLFVHTKKNVKMATLAETLADPSRPSFLFGTFILLSSITLFCISHDKKIEQICSFLSFKLALFSFSAISDDIRKRSIGNDGFLSALAFGYGDDD